MKIDYSAVVLAGGRSTRMGREKALLEVEGVPMWERQLAVLKEAGAAEIFLSARPEQTWARGVKGFDALLTDALATGGPMVGITAGLERMTRPWLAVLAIDLPQMKAAWFQQLRKECQPGVGAVGRNGDYFEPLAAIYPREVMSLAWEALVRGEFSLQKLIQRAVDENLMRVRSISADEGAWFENWNEPLARAEDGGPHNGGRRAEGGQERSSD
jgi:molybdopterin-guanine dinucleotide biosynthesis protein A